MTLLTGLCDSPYRPTYVTLLTGDAGSPVNSGFLPGGCYSGLNEEDS